MRTQPNFSLNVVIGPIQFLHNEALAPVRSRHVAALLVVALAVGACTTPYEGRYDFYSGWRKAQITQITAPDMKVTGGRCSEANPKSLPPGTSWAVVRYRLGGRTRYASAPAPMQQNFAVGDLVYVNVSDCLILLQRRPSPG